jgi:uncharacterized membrane protein YcaP (DUF421 family)
MAIILLVMFLEILKIVILSFSSIIVLFILTKLMGNREISQLNMFDYVVGITIGSIAAEMATSLENSFMEPLVAMIIYTIITILISFINAKSLNARKIITGKSSIIFDNGKFNFKNLKNSKFDINEFLMQCRINGYFNLSDIQTAILEPNGKLSFLPISIKRSSTPEDLNLIPKQEKTTINLIIDEKILDLNLKQLGFDSTWLIKKLNEQGFASTKNVLLATYDFENNLNVYCKTNLDN